MKHKPMNEFPLIEKEEGTVPLFWPNIPKNAAQYIADSLSTRWIGQGPKVEKFEKALYDFIKPKTKEFVSVSSGTAALHVIYQLAGIGKGDEVLCPVFTCTATNLALVYLDAELKFYDVGNNSLNASIEDIESKITKDTKAIVTVDYGGVPNDYKALRKLADKYSIPVIADLAHCIDGKIDGENVIDLVDYAMFSFQAIKTLTTGDGGMVICPAKDVELAKRLRWFGIDRTAKQKGTWENDIKEVGFKYQMTDIAASIGLAGLEELGEKLSKRRALASVYKRSLAEAGLPQLLETSVEDNVDFAPWLATIICPANGRQRIMEGLRDAGIESAQVHYRNDKYTVFKEWSGAEFPNMDSIEDNYLVLPLHTNMTEEDAVRTVSLLKELGNW